MNFDFDFCHLFLRRYNGILRFGAQVCLLYIWSFIMAENEICVIENIDGIDEILLDVNIIPFLSHSFLDVESVHQ
jgi:hypothetical protein